MTIHYRNVVLICCLFFSCQGQWTWISGSTSVNVLPTDPPLRVSSPNNTIGGKLGGAVWYGDNNDIWIYGGIGSSIETSSTFSTIWYFNMTSNEWTLVYDVGSVGANNTGPNITAGARHDFAYWQTAPNTIYIYGGYYKGRRSDLWKLEISATLDPVWTHVSGSLLENENAVYGPIGTPGVNYTPGGRSYLGYWTGQDGTFWVFGGKGRGGTGSDEEPLNDLWCYFIATNQWAYMGGSQGRKDPGIYKNTSDAWPCSREYPITWTMNGSLYLLGGSGEGLIVYNDLWRYHNGTWTWISGEVPTGIHHGVYGTKGVGTPNNLIGGRSNAGVWVDSLDRVWIFGGLGNTESTYGDLQDVWVLDNFVWIWVDGTTLIDAISQYSPLGTPSTVVPSSRSSPFILYLNDSYVWFYGGSQTSLGSTDKYFADVLTYDIRLINYTIQIPNNNNNSSFNELPQEIQNKSYTVAIVVPICIVAFLVISGVVGFLLWKRRRVEKNDNTVVMETVNKQESLYINLNELKNKELMLTGVVVQNLLGQGNFGNVYKGLWNDVPVALKELKEQNHFAEFKKEADLLCSLKSDYIVLYLGICSQNNNQFIVTELMTRGDATNVVRQKTLTTKELTKMCLDAAKGMEFIHSKNIIHRDLALRNLLVTDGSNGYIVKVSDFGMAKMMESQESYYKSEKNSHPIKWCSPETLKFGRYTYQSDVWAFGVLVWEVYSEGLAPYLGMNNAEAAEKVLAGYRLSKPEKCPESIFEIVTNCWRENPKERPTMKQIVSDVENVYVQLE